MLSTQTEGKLDGGVGVVEEDMAEGVEHREEGMADEEEGVGGEEGLEGKRGWWIWWWKT